MKKIFLFLAIILSNLNINAQEKINWLGFEEAIALNKENPKPILINVYADWCGYCKKLDLETYSNKTIAEYINTNFYAIKLDGEEKKDITFNDYTFKYQKVDRIGYHQLPVSLMEGKISFPTIIFLSKDEKIIEKFPGFIDKNRMEKLLVYFSKGLYNTENWVDFEKKFKSNL